MAKRERDLHSNTGSKFQIRNINIAIERRDKYYDYSFCEYDYSMVDLDKFKNYALPWWRRFADLLPFNNTDNLKSLGEGNTPLIASKKYKNCFIKDESRNPSGSFKDREVAVLIPYLIETGRRKFSVASSGNASISASLYSKIYDCDVKCYIPKKTSIAKKNIIKAYGGDLIFAGRDYEEAHRSLSDKKEVSFINITAGIHPLKGEGNKIISYEIHDSLRYALDYIIVPVGNGCLLSGLYYGFLDLFNLKLIKKIPTFVAVQIAGASPLSVAFSKKEQNFHILKTCIESKAEGIVALESFCSPKVLNILDKTDGRVCEVTEKELIAAMRYAVREEGLIPEWTSVSAFAALQKLQKSKFFKPDDRVVIINTGSGLKDIVNIVKELIQKNSLTKTA